MQVAVTLFICVLTLKLKMKPLDSTEPEEDHSFPGPLSSLLPSASQIYIELVYIKKDITEYITTGSYSFY